MLQVPECRSFHWAGPMWLRARESGTLADCTDGGRTVRPSVLRHNCHALMTDMASVMSRRLAYRYSDAGVTRTLSAMWWMIDCLQSFCVTPYTVVKYTRRLLICIMFHGSKVRLATSSYRPKAQIIIGSLVIIRDLRMFGYCNNFLRYIFFMAGGSKPVYFNPWKFLRFWIARVIQSQPIRLVLVQHLTCTS